MWRWIGYPLSALAGYSVILGLSFKTYMWWFGTTPNDVLATLLFVFGGVASVWWGAAMAEPGIEYAKERRAVQDKVEKEEREYQHEREQEREKYERQAREKYEAYVGLPTPPEEVPNVKTIGQRTK